MAENLTELEDDYEPPDVALMNALAEIGQEDGEATVSIYRATAEKGLKGGAFLFACTAAEFSLEGVRDTYGGGSYRVHVKKNGRIVPGGNRLVVIEEPRSGIPGQIRIQQPLNQIPALNNLDITKLVEAMQHGFVQLGTLIAQQSKSAPIDPQQMRRDVIADMLAMKQLFETPQHAQNSGQSPIDMLLKGVELAKQISPREGETGTTDVILEAIKTFGRPIAEAAMQGKLMAPQETVQYAQNPSPAPVQNIPQNPTVQPIQNGEDEMHAMMVFYARQLTQQAKNDRDPYVYANLLVDSLPEEKVQEILKGDSKEFLFTLDPELKQHEEWVDEFIKIVRELLTEEPEPGSFAENADNQSKPSEPKPAE